MATDLYPAARELLTTLVGFDTTSRGSNLPLIAWVEAYLDGLGVPHRRVPNADGTKSNLMATIGPAIPGGVVLSGHTDVVPVDGQPWSTDPFTVTEKGGRLYGRGTCDMWVFRPSLPWRRLASSGAPRPISRFSTFSCRM